MQSREPERERERLLTHFVDLYISVCVRVVHWNCQSSLYYSMVIAMVILLFLLLLLLLLLTLLYFRFCDASSSISIPRTTTFISPSEPPLFIRLPNRSSSRRQLNSPLGSHLLPQIACAVVAIVVPVRSSCKFNRISSHKSLFFNLIFSWFYLQT